MPKGDLDATRIGKELWDGLKDGVNTVKKQAEKKNRDWGKITGNLLSGGKAMILIIVGVIGLLIWFFARNFVFVIIFVLVGGFMGYKVIGSKKKWKTKGILVGGLLVLCVFGYSLMGSLRLSTSSEVGMVNAGVSTTIGNTDTVYYEVNRVTHSSTLTENSVSAGTSLASYGLFSDDMITVDWDQDPYGAPTITTDREYDTVSCTSSGVEIGSYDWDDMHYPEIGLLLHGTYVKSRVVVSFQADFQYHSELTLYGHVLSEGTGEIAGGWSPFGRNDYYSFGGKAIEGMIIFQFWSDDFIQTGMGMEEYEYLSTAIVDVSCITKQSTWFVRSLTAGDAEPDPLVETQTKPSDNGWYDWTSEIAGDCELYSTCDDALAGSSPITHYGFESLTLDDIWEQEVYVRIPYKILMGSNYDTAGDNCVKTNSMSYTEKYQVELEFVYTVVTGYDSLLIDNDNSDYDNEEDETQLDTILEELWNKIIGVWYTTFGKVIYIAVGIIVIISLLGFTFSGRGKSSSGGSRGGGSGVTVVNIMGDMKGGVDKAVRQSRSVGGKVKRKLRKLFKG